MDINAVDFVILGQAGGAGGGGIMSFMPIVILILIFYFMLIRPQQRREKERKKMIEEAKKGDRIMFAGGMLGTITNVKDTTFVIKIADNVKVEAVKASVSKVLEKGEKPVLDEAK